MPAVVSEKKRKYTITLYTQKPGPKGPHPQNQPASASKQVKLPSKQLTNHDWLTVFTWIDTNPHRSQQDAVDHFANQQQNPLQFNQGTLSHKLKKRSDIEEMVKVNPASPPARRPRVVVSPDVERALVLWVNNMLANGCVVNGPLLTAKCKVLEEKFNIPAEKRLKDKGWLQSFYWAYVSQTYRTARMSLTGASSYGLKEHWQHGEANPEDIRSERTNLKEINARYKPED